MFFKGIKHAGYLTYIAYLIPRATHAHEETIHKGYHLLSEFFLDEEFSLSVEDEDPILFGISSSTWRNTFLPVQLSSQETCPSLSL